MSSAISDDPYYVEFPAPIHAYLLDEVVDTNAGKDADPTDIPF